MLIKFTQAYEVKDGSGTTYAEGQTLECSDASANHFILRGVAVEEKPKPKKEAAKKK